MLIREQDIRSVKESKIYTLHDGLQRILLLQEELPKLGLKAYDFQFSFMVDCVDVVYRVHDITSQTEKGILRQLEKGYFYKGKTLYWNGLEPNLYDLSYMIRAL